MKSRLLFYLIAAICFLPAAKISAINDLVIKLPNSYSSTKGYMDKATLAIEPHGSYSEHSLYITYSDHGQYQKNQNVEIIHRFELPQGAVVNDLWLWIGDSVMQGRMYDTWKAKNIYDSIVNTKRDPAFLSKTGSQYELRIFPLVSGGSRRVKLNYIVPVKWNGKTAADILPAGFLNSNNSTQKPLEILFRSKENIWGNPILEESPNEPFVNKKDTLGFNYKYYYLADTKQYSSLTLCYQIDMADGTYFNASAGSDNQTYFQTLFSLKEAFNIQPDTASKRNIIAIDLSGNFNKNYTELIPRLKSLIGSSLKPNDRFKIVIGGAGQVKWLNGTWSDADIQNVNNMMNNFALSSFGEQVSRQYLPHLVFADKGAVSNLWYEGINSAAVIDDSEYLNSGKGLTATYNYFKQADVIAYYNDQPNDSILNRIYPVLDEFFERGGIFYCRTGINGKIPLHYINDLAAEFNSHKGAILFRNLDGNIGAGFPEQFTYWIDNYFIRSKDPLVKKEVTDINGNPVIISKKIRNGILIVSGISSAQDDISLKKMFANAFLRLNRTQKPSQILPLLNEVSKEFDIAGFNKVLLISNSDSLITAPGATTFALDYIRRFGNPPVINTVNLLGGGNPVFPGVMVDNTDYYGSGYLLKAISGKTGAMNFESHIFDWSRISQDLSPYSIPAPENITVEVTADEQPAKITDFISVAKGTLPGNAVRSYVGAAAGANQIEYKIRAKFPGIDSVQSCSFSFPAALSSRRDTIIPAMLGNEKIKALFSGQPVDTAGIITLALKYNLLCDFTALLCLEPDKNNPYMKNPFDEGKLTLVNDGMPADSVQMSVFPNPFNSQTKIYVGLRSSSKVSLIIYDILGRVVRRIADSEELDKSRVYVWDGKNDFNDAVSSGIYFARMHVKETDSGKMHVMTSKLLMAK